MLRGHHDPDASRRRLWCAWIRDHNRPFPEACRGMRCGAMTRRGTKCRRLDINRGGRCRLHGGHSTGPRSMAGKAASAANLPQPKIPKSMDS